MKFIQVCKVLKTTVTFQLLVKEIEICKTLVFKSFLFFLDKNWTNYQIES